MLSQVGEKIPIWHRKRARPSKSDTIRMTSTKRTEILSKLIPEIIDLKFTRTENDPYQTELDLNIFAQIIFLFKKNLLDKKSADQKSTRIENGLTWN